MQRIGVNFGAPGDRLVKEDSLWLDYPGEGLKWVAASGAEGLSSLSLSLGEANDGPRDYTVRLYFAEPDNVQPGERIFDVSIGEIPVLVNFDPIKVAGGRNQIVVKEFTSISINEYLELSFTAKRGKPLICGLEVIAESKVLKATDVVRKR